MKKTVIFALLTLSTAQADMWVKGDFHVHTRFSGGDATVEELATLAHIRGLDFIAITDHDNKTIGIPYAWPEITNSKSPTTLLYGMEWTHGDSWMTCHGHMNIWSDRPFEYSEIWRANQNDDALLAQKLILDQGALYSINHPKVFGFEWQYSYPDQPPAVEIWNGAFRLGNNRKTIRDVWSRYFDQGVRVTGVGGSDTHEIKTDSYTTLGNPTTWVFSKDKSAREILNGVKAGHVVISFAPDSPIAVLKTLTRSQFEIEILNENPKVKTHSVIVYKNGIPLHDFKLNGQKRLHFTDKMKPDCRTWYYIELHGNPGFKGAKRTIYGSLLSISNPLVFGSKSCTIRP